MKEINNKKMIHVNPKMKPPWQKPRKWHEKRIKGEKEKRRKGKRKHCKDGRIGKHREREEDK